LSCSLNRCELSDEQELAVLGKRPHLIVNDHLEIVDEHPYLLYVRDYLIVIGIGLGVIGAGLLVAGVVFAF
jgi:hypothetical protein